MPRKKEVKPTPPIIEYVGDTDQLTVLSRICAQPAAEKVNTYLMILRDEQNRPVGFRVGSARRFCEVNDLLHRHAVEVEDIWQKLQQLYPGSAGRMSSLEGLISRVRNEPSVVVMG